jgi:hypothetical protein
MTQNGKGDAPRPYSVPIETYKNNFDRIFGKKDADNCHYSGLASTQSYADTEDTMCEEYKKALNSGMFFEWFPGFTGTWEKDKERWKAVRR